MAVAGFGLAACGQSATTPSPSPTIPAGCNTPPGYVFTDGSAQATVTSGSASPAAAGASSSRSTQSINVTGVWTDQFESSRPNERYDPTAYHGRPWLNVNLGSSSKGIVVEIEGQDPCALSPASSDTYIAVVLGTNDSNRYGGSCSVKVDAFNSAGLRGSFNCTQLSQFGFESNAPTVAAQGTFAATGHVYTPTAAPTSSPSRSPAPSPSPSPTATPATPSPATTTG